MHIADITMFHAPHSGGVRRYLEAKSRWARKRFDHTLVVPAGTAMQRPGVRRLPAPSIPLGGGYRFPLRSAPWERCLEDLAPDLIEAGDPYRTAWAAVRAGHQLGVPVVGFYHSDVTRLIEIRFGRRARAATALYLRHLYEQMDCVLAPSRVMVRQLQALGLDNVAYQPLGVDTALFHPRQRDPTFRAGLGLPEDRRLLVFAGRPSAEKNIPVLLEAMCRLGGAYHLLLIGPGMPQCGARNVTVWPRYEGAGLPRVLASADALVHAGDRETFGLVVLEALACGTPVAGVRAGAVAEIVPADAGVLARPRDAGALASAIHDLCSSDPASIRLMRLAARRAVEARWTWDRAFATLLGRYLAILGLDRHGAGAEMAPLAQG